MLINEFLELVVGVENAPRYLFKFCKHVNRLSKLRMYTEIRDGDMYITNPPRFLRNLKTCITYEKQIKMKTVVEGVNKLGVEDVIHRS
jgi:hypothetical protein